MEAYRYQELVYLIVPITLGMEFFVTAKNEKKDKQEVPLGSYVLDLWGFIFFALIPAMFIFTIWAIESGTFPLRTETLARLDRYGVMFFFMGGWWQVYLITALRARRIKDEKNWLYIWGPYLFFGIFVSLLVLWVSPWNLKWVSVGWFIFIAVLMNVLKLRPKTIEKVFWILAGITFFVENIVFVWLETVV
ncbi:MAG: hypothetical protein D6726_04135 [Nitrospirae bacterium]|nr:MAG: hypothetical protein D6726_04135 [Nitrospirota bacterium]